MLLIVIVIVVHHLVVTYKSLINVTSVVVTLTIMVSMDMSVILNISNPYMQILLNLLLLISFMYWIMKYILNSDHHLNKLLFIFACVFAFE